MDLIDRHLTSKTRTPALAITFVLVIGFLAIFGALHRVRRGQPGYESGQRSARVSGPAQPELRRPRSQASGSLGEPGEGRARSANPPALRRYRVVDPAPDSAHSFRIAESDLRHHHSDSQFFHSERRPRHSRQLPRIARQRPGRGEGDSGRASTHCCCSTCARCCFCAARHSFPSASCSARWTCLMPFCWRQLRFRSSSFPWSDRSPRPSSSSSSASSPDTRTWVGWLSTLPSTACFRITFCRPT